MEYNRAMDKEYQVIIIGGGASGLFSAARFAQEKNTSVLLIERADRLGKKLSATGNGQGNISNEKVGNGGYFSQDSASLSRVDEMIEKYGKAHLVACFESLGGLLESDERGRVYPTGRQASSITDLLRKTLSLSKNVDVLLKAFVKEIKPTKDGFFVVCQTEDGEKTYFAPDVLLCTGGKAAKNFGTDGNGYALAKSLGHTVTTTYPSLVQLKTDTAYIKTLKGIRVNDACVRAFVNGEELTKVIGDVIFTDYGVSGDAIFRISAFITDKIESKKVQLFIDFLPNITHDKLREVLQRKARFIDETGEILCGIVNNQIGRAICRFAQNDLEKIVDTIKAFPLSVLGTLGYDYAQVTKGGVPLIETDKNLQSSKKKGLYLLGEILDVDGECGGFNLQFAYTCACVATTAIIEKNQKRKGQV